MSGKLVRTLKFKVDTEDSKLLDWLRKEFRNTWNQYIKHTEELGTTNRRELEEQEVETSLIQNTRQCARDKAREAVKSFFKQKKHNNNASYPEPKKRPMAARLNHRDGYTVNKDHTVRISTRPYKTVKGKLKGSPKDEKLLNKTIKGEYKFGTAELTKHGNNHYLHINIENGEKPSYNKDEEHTFIGVDLNESNITLSAVNEGGEVLETLLLEYKQIKSVKHKYFTIRKRMQKHGKKLILHNKEERIIKDLVHKISRIAVEFSKRFNNSVLVLEDLTNIRDNMEFDKKNNRRLHNWNFKKLKHYITYKAEWCGVYVHEVRPDHTSQTCPVCGDQDSNYKNGRRFKCNCGHQDHRDRNASLNIALKAMKKLLDSKNVPSLKNFPSFEKVRWMASGLVNRPAEDIAKMSCSPSGSPTAQPCG